jgi:hypothetical protein
LLVVGLILILSLAGGILAQWRSARMRALLLAPAPPTPPGSPSKEYIYAGGRLLATEEQTQGTSPSPTALAANATSTTQVSLSWTAPATGSVDHYQIERAQITGSFTLLNGNPTTTSFNDTTASSVTAYLYRVCAFDAAGNRSAYSNVDLATTIIFTDDPLSAALTPIKAQHLTELRQAVNAVRVLAGLAAANWTDSSPTGVTIKAMHIQELRNNLDQALGTLGLTVSAYTDPTLSSAVHVKKAHMEELRQRLK